MRGDGEIVVRIAFSWCVLVLVAAITTSVFLGKEMGQYNLQLEATCRDDKSAGLMAGSALAAVTYDTSRRSGDAILADYSCTFFVEASIMSTQAVQSNFLRYTYNVFSGFKANASSDITTVIKLCNTSYSWNGTYGCYVVEGTSDIRSSKNGFPLELLISTCVLWVMFATGLTFGCILAFCVSLPDSVVCEDSHSTSLKVVPTSGEEDDGPTKVAAGGKFRKIIPEDLSKTLIPGLVLRVQWPPCGPFKRWYVATATRYDVTAQTITFEYHHFSVPFCETTLPISTGRVRLHESSLCKVARRRIIKGVIEGSIFGGRTFARLDRDGNGALNPEEISAGLKRHDVYLDKSTLDSLVQLLDQDGSGKVDASEFKAFLTKSELPKKDILDQVRLTTTWRKDKSVNDRR